MVGDDDEAVRACVRERALACASRVVSLLLLSLTLLLLLLCDFFVCLLCFVFCRSCSCVLQSFFFPFFGGGLLSQLSLSFFCLKRRDDRPHATQSLVGSFRFSLGSGEGFLFFSCFLPSDGLKAVPAAVPR
jgi:hypothetical protein